MPDGTPMIDKTTLPRLLDVPGLAAHLGVKERHIRRLIAERRIPLFQVGPPNPLRPRRHRGVAQRQSAGHRLGPTQVRGRS